MRQAVTEPVKWKDSFGDLDQQPHRDDAGNTYTKYVTARGFAE